jgi:hypothetical protein
MFHFAKGAAGAGLFRQCRQVAASMRTQFYYLQCSFDPLENLFSGTRPRFNLEANRRQPRRNLNAAHIRRQLGRGSGRGA